MLQQGWPQEKKPCRSNEPSGGSGLDLGLRDAPARVATEGHPYRAVRPGRLLYTFNPEPLSPLTLLTTTLPSGNIGWAFRNPRLAMDSLVMRGKAKSDTSDKSTLISDPELAAACLAGDPKAWELLILRYQRLIYSIPIKMGLSGNDAADIFQTICLRIFEKLSTIRDHEKLSSWIITATTRECWRISALTRRESVADARADGEQLGEIESLVAAPVAYDDQVLLEQQQLVRDAVAALPDRCRELIAMLFYRKEEVTYSEIARRMKMPVSSIGPTRTRCLEKLKKLLEGKV
jgi:RNA polymerase sigma factor (sigma-70 family)